MVDSSNPFRPGAGHQPPYLAGRHDEREQFLRLITQRTIVENLVLTGLRGTGKTVLLDSFKPLATRHGWLWVGADLSESASISEDNLAVRLCADLSPLTAGVAVRTDTARAIGFAPVTGTIRRALDYRALTGAYAGIPGLSLDKLKGVLETAWSALSGAYRTRGVVFAYDEAQNLANQGAKDEYPLSLLLDAFQSLQRKGLPLMLALAGLPTLLPRLVDARTFAERMFRVVFLDRLNASDSEDAIRKPVTDAGCPVRFSDDAIRAIVDTSCGYPYFLQFICREAYDAFLQRVDKGARASVPVADIERKLDVDFFAGRWARATDRQRELLAVIAGLDHCDDEFTVQQAVEQSQRVLKKPFSASHVSQMLAALASRGLVFKNRHGRYSFALPLLGGFIRRQTQERTG